MATTRITESRWEAEDGTERVQHKTTVPKGLVEAMDLAGAEVEWKVESENRVSLIVKERTDGE